MVIPMQLCLSKSLWNCSFRSIFEFSLWKLKTESILITLCSYLTYVLKLFNYLEYLSYSEIVLNILSLSQPLWINLCYYVFNLLGILIIKVIYIHYNKSNICTRKNNNLHPLLSHKYHPHEQIKYGTSMLKKINSCMY